MNGQKAVTGEDKLSMLRTVLAPDRVCFLDTTTKDASLRAVIERLAASPCVQDGEELTRAVFKREDLMSTGIGLGLAVPHVRLVSVTQLVMAVGISQQGIEDYASLDDKPVHLIFLIAAPQGQHAEYVRLLSVISTRAKFLGGHLLECPDPETFYRVFAGIPEGDGACPDASS
jgi:PTS system nitrogen regulatory IIA component